MIYVFLANGFEEIEALTPVDVLRRAGRPVTTVGIGGKEVTGAHGICVKAEIADAEMNFSEEPAEMIVLPGGMPGTRNLEASSAVRSAVEWCVQHNVWIGAICAAPSILGHWGVLKGHVATCFPGYEEELGCTVQNVPVVQSDKLITARGAGVALPFALQLTAALCGKTKSEEIGKAMQCV